jgi:hypothetical protein
VLAEAGPVGQHHAQRRPAGQRPARLVSTKHHAQRSAPAPRLTGAWHIPCTTTSWRLLPARPASALDAPRLSHFSGCCRQDRFGTERCTA